jgi:hypothetical protein
LDLLQIVSFLSRFFPFSFACFPLELRSGGGRIGFGCLAVAF